MKIDFGDIGDFDLDLDLDGFDLADPQDRHKNRYVLPKRTRKIASHAVNFDHAMGLAKALGNEIMNGETVHALLSGNFIFGDFFEALSVDQNIYIDELIISTLSISAGNVLSLRNLLRGDYIGDLGLIVSDYFWSHNRQNAPFIYEHLDINDSFQLAVAGTHTKITLMRVGERKIVVTGSANLRSSRSMEEITIQTCHTLFDFHHEWHSKILEEYGTIKKSIRASKLFDLVTKNAKGATWQNPDGPDVPSETLKEK